VASNKEMLRESACCNVYFNCFRGMLQVFRMDVAKVDRDVAYVAMAMPSCCKRLFQMFYLFFRRMLQAFYLNVAYVASVFIWMLHMLAMTFNCFQVFYKCFRCMLQLFQFFRTYATSVSSGCCKSRSDVAHVGIGPTCYGRFASVLDVRYKCFRFFRCML
jgi:hypothetical protein